jgi:hypothetical protein
MADLLHLNLDYNGRPIGLFRAWYMDDNEDVDILTTNINFESCSIRIVGEESIDAMNFRRYLGPSLTGSYSVVIGDFVSQEQLNLAALSMGRYFICFEMTNLLIF